MISLKKPFKSWYVSIVEVGKFGLDHQMQALAQLNQILLKSENCNPSNILFLLPKLLFQALDF